MAEKMFYENEYTEEQKSLAEEIISLEKGALDKWFNGDSFGYREIWSEKSFTYFDSVMDHRVDTYAEIAEFVKGAVDGMLF